jgi:hypothetical protein
MALPENEVRQETTDTASQPLACTWPEREPKERDSKPACVSNEAAPGPAPIATEPLASPEPCDLKPLPSAEGSPRCEPLNSLLS